MIKRIINLLSRNITYLYRIWFKPKIIINYGIKIINSNHISSSIKKFLYSNKYENEEISILENVLKKRDKVLEIGSGLGFLTIYCAMKNGNTSIVSYEANPSLIKIIKDNFQINNVSPYLENSILSNQEGVVDFYIENHFWSSSQVQRSEDAKKIRVKTIDINKVINERDINFLLIDIEGSENELIYQIDFEKINKIIIEIHPHVIGDKNATRIISHLEKNGFSLNFDCSKGIVFYFYKKNEF